MTERFGDDVVACAAAVGPSPPLEARAAIGVAGTVTTLAALDLGLVRYDERVHGHVVPRASLDSWLARLAACRWTNAGAFRASSQARQ